MSEAKAVERYDWQERVFNERDDLADKLGRLDKFLDSLDEDCNGYCYMTMQQGSMNVYLYSLNRRIELFKYKEERD